MPRTKYIPKLVTVLKEGYSFSGLLNDMGAGIIVAIVALPLSIAFAIASGVKPEQGLYTAIVAGFIISLLSGSRVQVGGPTGAFVVIIYGIIQKFGYEGLATATIIAGLLLIIMGFARLGSIIKFIPYPVTIGFTSGIALIIFTTQIKDFFGLKIDDLPAEFIGKIHAYFFNFHSINFYSLFIGILTLAIIIFWPKITYKIPGSFAAILITTLIVVFLKIPVETIGTKFGSVPNMFPLPKIPIFNIDLIVKVFPSAITIAILAGIESLLSCVVADGMTGGRHRSNMELVAQGAANIFSVIFGGIPATGAIARTATNIKNGGKTPFAGIIHAVTLFLIMILFSRWTSYIPMATLAGILIVVAVNMSEYHIFIKLFKSPKSDILVLLTTFLLTILLDLTIAIQVGIVMAAFLFMYRMSNVTEAKYITDSLTEEEEFDDPYAISKREVPPGVEIFEIYGPFFFGAVDKFKDSLMLIEKFPKILILRMRHVYAIDATGLRALEDVVNKSLSNGIIIILSGVRTQPLLTIQKALLFDKIGSENICADIDGSLARASYILG